MPRGLKEDLQEMSRKLDYTEIVLYLSIIEQIATGPATVLYSHITYMD